MLLVPWLCVSCFSENLDGCPNGRVLIAVQDTEYENADAVSKALGVSRSEDGQPIGNTLNSMIVIHHDRETDDYVSWDAAVSATDPYHYLRNECFTADGRNAVMVIGNATQSAGDYPALAADGRISDIDVSLHSDNGERRDIFIGRGLVSIPVMRDTVVWMQRATGKLLVQVQNMPATITRATLHIENLATDVNWNLTYSGNMPLARHEFDMNVDATVMEVNLPPNFEGESSPVTVHLSDGNDITTLSAVPVVMERNKITLLRLTYAAEGDRWDFHILVDGAWERVEPLELPDEL